MVVDLAYIIRHELLQFGYRSPDLIGYFLLPSEDGTASRPIDKANTYATFEEMRYFAKQDRYMVRFDMAEAPIIDDSAPFSRLAVAQFHKDMKERYRRRVLGLIGRRLYTELLTPAGRVVDQNKPAASNAEVAESFGVYRLHHPRAELLDKATRRFAQRLLRRWSSKESSHLTQAIRDWLQTQWKDQKLDPAAVFGQLEETTTAHLGRPAEEFLSHSLDPFLTRTPGAAKFEASAARSVLQKFWEYLGHAEPEQDRTATLRQALADKATGAASAADKRLATLAVSFLEQPQYRLAGAEEAMNQLTRLVERTVDELESIRQELASVSLELQNRAEKTLSTLETGGFSLTGRRGTLIHELIDSIRLFGDKRIGLLEVEAAITFYRSLLGNIPDYLREVSYCRTKLEQFVEQLEPKPRSASLMGPGTVILPPGSENVDDAIEQFLEAIHPEDALGFDLHIQSELKGQFRGLANLCLKQGYGNDFLTMLQNQAGQFLNERLGFATPADLMVSVHDQPERLVSAVATAMHTACPEYYPPNPEPGQETAVIAVPPGESGEQVWQAARQAAVGVEWQRAEHANEILFVRDISNIPWEMLPQLGEEARSAYQSRLSGEHPASSRSDIRWQQ